jgi:isochorismate synthase
MSPSACIDAVRPQTSFVLATRRRTLVATGPPVATAPGHTLPQRVQELCAELEGADPIVLGAAPFDPSAAARLFVPAEPRPPNGRAAARPPRVLRVRATPEPAEYVRCVRRTLRMLDGAGLRKVVLARTLELALAAPLDVGSVLAGLARADPRATVFAVELSDRVLFGATPELLVSRRGMRVTANPLAGSIPAAEDPAEDRARAGALVASEKDRREHALVVDAVAATLRPFCGGLVVPRRPSLLRTATMWHLSSRIVGVLADPSVSALMLATALHPTPAVCGSPARAARDVIREIEPFDRGFFTGMVGWSDARGDGEWFVAIRCAEASARSLRLFAGAGIVAGSRAEDELAETAAKCRTVLRAAGIEQQVAREARIPTLERRNHGRHRRASHAGHP